MWRIGSAGANDAVQRVDLHVEHHARARRPQVEARQPLAQAQPLLLQLHLAEADLAQLRDRLLSIVCRLAHALDLVLGDLAPQPRDLGPELARLALEARRLALQRQHAAGLSEPLVEQRLLVRQLLGDQLGLAHLGGKLGLGADDLLAQLDNLLAQHLELLGGRFALGIEQRALALDQLGDLAVALGNLDDLGVKLERVGIDLRRLEAAAPGDDLVELALERGELRAQQRVVEPQQHLAFLHDIAVPHQDFADDAAIWMLDDLLVDLDAQLSGGDDRARQLGRGGPCAEAAAEQQHQEEAKADEAAARPAIVGQARRPAALWSRQLGSQTAHASSPPVSSAAAWPWPTARTSPDPPSTAAGCCRATSCG